MEILVPKVGSYCISSLLSFYFTLHIKFSKYNLFVFVCLFVVVGLFPLAFVYKCHALETPFFRCSIFIFKSLVIVLKSVHYTMTHNLYTELAEFTDKTIAKHLS